MPTPRRIFGVALLACAFGLTVASPAGAVMPTMFIVDEGGDPAANAADCTNGSPGDCSLRDAVLAANAAAGREEILLTTNVSLSIPPSSADESSAASGDLDLTGPVSVRSIADAPRTIDANDLDRVFDVVTTGLSVDLIGLVLQEGRVAAPNAEPAGFTAADGGAIRTASNTALVVSGVTIRDSEAVATGVPNTAASGGAIAMDHTPTLTIIDSLIQDNTAYDAGGGVSLGGAGNATIEGSTFEGNSARFGGAIRNGSPLTIEHSTFNANTNPNGGNGGSAIGFNAAVTVRHSTVAENNGNLDSGFRGDASVSFVGSILQTSDPDPICNTDFLGATYTSNGSNVLSQPSGCAMTDGANGDDVGANPALGALGDNGGPTPTMLPGVSSDAIDHAGDCESTHPFDQRYGKRKQGAECDAGAVEVGGLADVAIVGWTAPAEARVGEDVTFTGTLANHGPDTAGGASVEVWFPEEAQIRSATLSGTPCAVGADAVTCSAGAMPAGAQRTLTVVAMRSAPGLLDLVAIAANPDQGDWPTSNSTAIAVTDVVPTPTTGGGGGASAGDGSGGGGAGGAGGQPLVQPQSFPFARPTISRVSMLRRRFRVARAHTPLVGVTQTARGSAFRLSLSAPAVVTIRIERPARGRRVGRRCVRATPANRGRARCVRYSLAGPLLRREGRTGVNTIPFTGRIGRRPLRPGTYRATLVGSNPAGASATSRIAFSIVPG